ncbi:MAG: thymidine phosphorylase [Candidatus Pacearchaeota archaeon]
MKLKTKFLDWYAGLPVAMMNKKTAAKMGVNTRGRISLKTNSDESSEYSTLVDIIEGLVKEDEIAISKEMKEKMGLKKEGQEVDVNLTGSPYSLNYIKKKLESKRLSKEEVESIISDIVGNELSQPETSLFVSAMYVNGMTFKETTYLIDAIVKQGHTLNLGNKIVADKHSIGGIPGNRTTPLVVSICAAAGLTMPKNSSKAITSAAGTADTVETLTNVEFSVKELEKIVKKAGASLAWGGSVGMVPADSKIIRVEKMIQLDPRAQLLASIMSKKLAVGSNHIIIDIPYGSTAKVTKKEAEKLRQEFNKLGKHYKIEIKVVLTKADGPIGRGIGPVLEMKDILGILNPEEKGPRDLEDKSVFLAGNLLEMSEKAEKGKGEQKAREILHSGEAFEKFKEIIKSQGGKIKDLKSGSYKEEIYAGKSGKIKNVDNQLVNSVARNAGCPADKKAGICLEISKGEKVKKNEKLFTIFAESKSRLEAAKNFCKEHNPVEIE